MALNLSTLTSPATSGDVLAEALTTADFLEPVPVLRNLSRGSNKGSDATQDVALNQPKALPLIKNPAGDLGGYLYIPDVAGNYATGPSVTIGANQTFEAEVDMIITQLGNYIMPIGAGGWTGGIGVLIWVGREIRVFSKSDVTNLSAPVVPLNTPFNLKYGFDGTNVYAKLNDQTVTSLAGGSNQANSITNDLQLNQQTLPKQGNYAIQKAKLTVGSSVVFDCDFNGSTSIRHGDTKFQASVGGPVTINQSGNDPATIIKKPVLRFDGVNDFIGGLFNQTLDGGYMFAVFSVLGDGGIDYGRIISTNKTGSNDTDTVSGFIWAVRNNVANDLHYYTNGGFFGPHHDFFDSDRGDYIYELKNTSGSQKSKVNGADLKTSSVSTSLELQEFYIGAQHRGEGRYTAIDLQYLALFPASITDAQADDVRNYINNRNNVFSLIDSQGYYFFDPQIFPIASPAAFVSYWNGNIVGSDNTLNASVSQSTVNDQPTRDGYKVTFNDNADHLVVASPLSGGQAGWQIVGTSLGTFAYRVNNNAVTELNLLGNAGVIRSVGDLYGIILLPASATGADIEEARKLLIDRGASDAVSASSVQQFWQSRNDIVEFKQVDTSSVTSFKEGWRFCASLEIFPPLQAPNCTNFLNAWQGTSALTSFPSGAKLGTSASNVNFTSAWQDSGLTSFPDDIDLSKGGQFLDAWHGTNLTSFSTPITGVNAKRMRRAWRSCTALTDFSYNVFANWNPVLISSAVFDGSWSNCTSLTAQSVENILTSIDASGKYATSTGASGGSALGNAGIDISYNTATGSLSAATNAAVTSLKSKGWSIIVNNVTL
jgi:hypothetical protein